jgi:hypothetical protein
MIREALLEQTKVSQESYCALAGAASGGDIVFHEVCDELGIPSEVYLAKPPSDYIEDSVSDGGSDWIARFAAVTASRPVHVLPQSDGVPGLSVWERSNLEMLQAAGKGGRDVTLIALWNGEAADGPGGASDMVKRVRERGGRAVILDAKKLLDR